MVEKAISLGWDPGTVALHTHACYYYSDEPTLRRSLQFIRDGLDVADDLCVIFADASRFDELKAWLQEPYDGDINALEASGKLAMIGGAPTMEALLARIGGRLDQGMAAGYSVIRFLGFIAWGEPGWPEDDTLLEFESKVNDVVTSYPAVIVCTYGVPKLGGNHLIYGGLQTHPTIWLDDRTVSDNPFYVPRGQTQAR